jgi:thiamine-phosphate pyrophosphorylase
MQASAYDAVDELSRIAARLHADSGAPAALPALFALTDPDRTPDVVAFAKSLPEGAGLILRHFGQPRPRMASMDIAAVATARKLVYLIGADPDLAAVVSAQGVHWPERMPKEASSYKRHQPARLMTMAAHSLDGLTAAKEAKADAVILGPVFETKSASGHAPLGVERFTELVAAVDLPVYALGGITARNAHELADTGACGIAGIEAFAGKI